ncbi:uncharacterized protein LOC142606188 [Castanea sativa]|uniref:uncharacterized protein LOC142606188 n=1 Tax=Castanea sativa TaxID=21020 RepID=UPI003F64AC43
MDKSLMYFSSNTSPQQRDVIKALLGVREVDKFESYLGLPTLVGRKKYHTFSFLKDRVWKKLQGWKGKMLSRAGKEILIKTVAQSIPTYTMGVFQLPVKLCEELQALCARFWWGQIGNKKKIHWVSLDKLIRPKLEGGMGFKDLRQFNLAILAKQDSPTSSFTWKSILEAKPILKRGLCWRVDNRASIWVLSDAWIPNHPSNRVLYPTRNVEEDLMVVELIDPDTRWWDREFIMQKFNREDGEAILRVPLSRRVISDSGEYTDNRCEVCKIEAETEIHALWNCGVTRDVWAGYSAQLQKCVGGQADVLQLMEELMDCLSTNELEHFLVQAWVIWNQRNGIIHGRKLQPLEEGGTLGIGAIIRNDKGEVMAALSVKGPPMTCSEEAEILACHRAVEFVVECGFIELVLEGDNQALMNALSSRKGLMSWLGHILQDVICMLNGLRWLQVLFAKRSANTVAHALARYAKDLLEDVVWLEDSPPLVVEALYCDSISI